MSLEKIMFGKMAVGYRVKLHTNIQIILYRLRVLRATFFSSVARSIASARDRIFAADSASP